MFLPLSAPTDFAAYADPTRRLPPLKREPSSIALFSALCHLSVLYSPQSLSAAERALLPAQLPEWTESETWSDALDSARVDENERRYAMSWLTRLIASGLTWLPTSDDDGDGTDGHGRNEEAKEKDERQKGGFSAEGLLDLAGRVLGGQAALEEAGAITRDFHFPLAGELELSLPPPRNGGTPLQLGEVDVQMHDESLPPSESRPSRARQQNESGETPPSDHSSGQLVSTGDPVDGVRRRSDPEDTSKTAAAAVGVQTWAAAVILSDLFLRRPDLFHSHFLYHQPPSASAVGNQKPNRQSKIRIHELGAGTGLVGISVAKGLQNHHLSAHITLSDFHDQVLQNLRYNLGQNFGPGQASSVTLDVIKVDWAELHALRTRMGRAEAPGRVGKAHLLLLADVIYEPMHAVWLKSSIEELLLLPHEEDEVEEEEGQGREREYRDDRAGEVPPRSAGSGAGTSRAHILIALRTSGKFEGLHRTVEQVFGRMVEGVTPIPRAVPPPTTEGTDTQHKREREAWQLRILSITELQKRQRLGRDDEQGYLWFEIGWVPRAGLMEKC